MGMTALLPLALVVLSGCEFQEDALAEPIALLEVSTEYQDLRVLEIATGLEQPWAVAFLPDDRLLVTERPGRLQLLENGVATEISGLPPIHVQNQGGLLDVVVHPDYPENGWIYLTYSKGDAESSVPALIRARLEGNALVDLEELFESNTYTSPGRHYGSRILFLGDGTLLMTIGDRGADPPRAQDPLDHSGTVVRLNADGSIPDDNPFVGNPEVAPEIYTWGHRNIQGIIQHPGTGEIWATEHGPRGGDELNLIVPGRNYGWPTASLGREYPTQEPFSDLRDHGEADMTDPVFEFLPTLAPSGLAVVTEGASTRPGRGTSWPAGSGPSASSGSCWRPERWSTWRNSSWGSWAGSGTFGRAPTATSTWSPGRPRAASTGWRRPGADPATAPPRPPGQRGSGSGAPGSPRR
jgi:aldose sugar dehydrogenase